MVTTRDIAERAGVSQPAVSWILNDNRFLPVAFTTAFPDLDELAQQIVARLMLRLRHEGEPTPQRVLLPLRLLPGESSLAEGGRNL